MRLPRTTLTTALLPGIALLCMAVVEIRAQSGEWAVPSEAEQLLERSIPCSPEAAAIQRLAEFPMDYSTGVPNISIPVFEIAIGEWSLPVAIYYNASGIRVQEVASSVVGLGWTLDAGGFVTRAIKGNVDGVHDMVFHNEYDVATALAGHRFTNHEMHRIAIGASDDTESDRYSYSFGGRSGCFRRNVRDMSLRTIPYSTVRVEEVPGGFVVTDTDGTRWHFTQEERSQNPSTSDATATGGTWRENQSQVLMKHAYHYKYDHCDRQVEKRLPGCQPVTIVYDCAGLPTFTQDGNQRSRGEWTFHLYDRHGRGVVEGVTTATPRAMSSLAAVTRHTGTGGMWGYENPLGLASYTIEKATYYDNYDFLDDLGSVTSEQLVPDASGTSDPVFPAANAPAAAGMQTGWAMGCLGDTCRMAGATYYGDRGRVVQEYVADHTGRYRHEYHTYSFTGQPLVTRRTCVEPAGGSGGMQPVCEETTTRTYDNHGRLLQTRHRMGTAPEVTLASNTYDEVGRLASTIVGGVETVNYDYNVRGWVTGISSPKFTQSLAYDTSTGAALPLTPRYDGSISATSWRTASMGQGTAGYRFDYDGLGRLAEAGWTGSSSQDHSVFYTYDTMGNMTEIIRQGRLGDNSYGYMDDLQLEYDGNRLVKADNLTTNNGAAGDFSFTDGSSASVEYLYDANGNMTADLNKGVSLTYNRLNLPLQAAFPYRRSMAWVHGADGTKLRVTHSTGMLQSAGVPSVILLQPIVTTTDYCGNLLFENGELSRLLVDGGYVTFTNGTPHYHFQFCFLSLQRYKIQGEAHVRPPIFMESI